MLTTSPIENCHGGELIRSRTTKEREKTPTSTFLFNLLPMAPARLERYGKEKMGPKKGEGRGARERERRREAETKWENNRQVGCR
jgi:hypothetical protein